MSNLEKGSLSPQREGAPDELWVEEVIDMQKNVLCDESTLKRVSKHLSRQKRKKRKLPLQKGCSCRDFGDFKVDRQVKLKCRQLPNVVEQLRRAVMRQDWDESTTLVCFILLLSHPNSSLTLLQQFIRLTTDYILEEDVNKFIRILFALRKASLEPLESGKYIRKTGDYKVVRDLEFEKL